MDVSTVKALAGPEGQELLRSLPPYSDSTALTLQNGLRKAGHPPELVAAALTQQRLRARAVEKFGEFASDMLFTLRASPCLSTFTKFGISWHSKTRWDLQAGHGGILDRSYVRLGVWTTLKSGLVTGRGGARGAGKSVSKALSDM